MKIDSGDTESDAPELSPDNVWESLRKTAWLVAAFLPSALAVACVWLQEGKTWVGYTIPLALILSIASSIGLVSKGDDRAPQFWIGCALFFAFLFLNALVVIIVALHLWNPSQP